VFALIFHLSCTPLFPLVLTLSVTVARSSRSDHAANRFSFVMKAMCGRRSLVNGL
jgi:hypothetical protein